MRSKKLVYITFIAMILSIFKNTQADENGSLIHWPGSSAYEDALKSFSISVDEAHQMLVGKTRDHPDRFFDRTPIFIVGEEYFFAEPSKLDVPLQGFYINGNTGVIEYRKTSVTIKAKQKKLPKDAYKEIHKIN